MVISSLHAQRRHILQVCANVKKFFLTAAEMLAEHEVFSLLPIMIYFVVFIYMSQVACEQLIATTQAALTDTRTKSDEQLTELETKLAEQIEQLRQSKDTVAVEEALNAVIQTINDIETAYRTFHDDMVAIARGHVSQLEKLMADYGKKCCEFLGVAFDDGALYVFTMITTLHLYLLAI